MCSACEQTEYYYPTCEAIPTRLAKFVQTPNYAREIYKHKDRQGFKRRAESRVLHQTSKGYLYKYELTSKNATSL